jgi:hypothetical protein
MPRPGMAENECDEREGDGANETEAAGTSRQRTPQLLASSLFLI